MIRINSKRKLPLWSIALASLVATSLSTGMTAAAEAKAHSPKPGFLQNTLCKLCPKVPQNNTALDNCIRNCPEGMKKNIDALIAQIKEKEKLRSSKISFIESAKLNPKAKTEQKNAEQQKAKIDSEIKVLNGQIDKINHGLDRVRKALSTEIQSKEQKRSETLKKHTKSAEKGINQRGMAKQDKEIKSIDDQINKLKDRKQRIDTLFFSSPSEATTITPSSPLSQPTRVPPPLPEGKTAAGTPAPVEPPPLPARTQPGASPTASGSSVGAPPPLPPRILAPAKPTEATHPESSPPPPPLPPRASDPAAPAGSPSTSPKPATGLLGQIQQGTPLKKVDPNAPKADLPPQQLTQQQQLAKNVADAMAARRGAMKPKTEKANDDFDWQ